MHRIKVASFHSALCLYLSPLASAQSPISIEQLLVKPSTWQLSSSFAYRTAAPAPQLLEQIMHWSTGLRYGVTPRFELNARLQGSRLSQRVQEQRFHEERRKSLSLGANWLMKPESALPALLIEARAMLVSRGGTGQQTLPSGQFAFTTYKSMDPVVISLNVATTLRRSYRIDGDVAEPGSSWRVEPMVNFAVNPDVTLFAGVGVERRNAGRLGGRRLPAPGDRVGLRGGVALAFARYHSIFVSGELANDHSGGVSVQWFYEF